MRTAVVDRVHLLTLGEQAERVPVETQHQPARRAQLRERSGRNTTINADGGQALLLSTSAVVASGANAETKKQRVFIFRTA
jgi:hypothetical protein